MSTMSAFYTTAPPSGMLTVPEEFRGKPLKIAVEEEPVTTKRSTMREFVAEFSGILKDCPNEDVCGERLPSTGSKRGILGLRGILKDCSPTELEDARYEYLMEKYS